MTTTYEAYFDFLEKLRKTLEELTELAKQKTAAVMKDDLHGVDACMRKEQALALSLRSMDIKRDKMLAELGLSGIPLSGLAEHCPEEYRLQAKKITEAVKNQYACYKGAAEVSRTTLECNLHQMEKLQKRLTAMSPPSGGVADIRI